MPLRRSLTATSMRSAASMRMRASIEGTAVTWAMPRVPASEEPTPRTMPIR